jgi:hypothetical protein
MTLREFGHQSIEADGGGPSFATQLRQDLESLAAYAE